MKIFDTTKRNMKTILICAFLIIFYQSCSTGQNSGSQANDVQSEEITDNSVDLKMTAIVRPNEAIGYAIVFKGTVQEIVTGSLKDSIIQLTIFPGEHPFMDSLHQTLTGETLMEMGFRKHRNNEKYGMIPINGFVDKNMTSWEIVYFNPVIKEE